MRDSGKTTHLRLRQPARDRFNGFKTDGETDADAMERLTLLLQMKARDSMAQRGQAAWKTAIDQQKARGEG